VQRRPRPPLHTRTTAVFGDGERNCASRPKRESLPQRTTGRMLPPPPSSACRATCLSTGLQPAALRPEFNENASLSRRFRVLTVVLLLCSGDVTKEQKGKNERREQFAFHWWTSLRLPMN